MIKAIQSETKGAVVTMEEGVREVIRMPTITKMPNVPQHVEGIINLRGKVIPIISMRRRFN